MNLFFEGLGRGIVIAAVVTVVLALIYYLLDALNLLPTPIINLVSSLGFIFEIVLFFAILYFVSKKESKNREEKLRKEVEEIKQTPNN